MTRKLALFCAAILLAACTETPRTPEDEIRALIARAEAAAERKDTGELMSFVSDSFSGAEGMKKNELQRFLAYQFLRRNRVFLTTRIASISFPEPQRSQAVVFVAAAATESEEDRLLPTIDADIHRVDVAFAEEEPHSWRLLGATWQAATLDDLGLE